MPAASTPAKVTRIVRRQVTPGHEEQFEAIAREMFATMQRFPGFLGATLIPPDAAGDDYQVVNHFASEEALKNWDASPERADILHRFNDHAENEPEFRRLTGLEAWFTTATVPASMHPPKHRMTFVTWLGIWPTASLLIWGLQWLWGVVRPPFLVQTAVTTALIALAMSYLVMPRLTRLMKGFLVARPAPALRAPEPPVPTDRPAS